ncbi:MAG TPA: type I restriction endonuclease subunit R, partial [Candidatus Ozemobacteraceae bacterium]|nr:type I restriction endonuclease subunit R [Candidatus Ozemobacteraceae bacterium]
AKAFCRCYDFLASLLPYSNAAWEKLSIFLNYLIPKLPTPREEDLTKGILELIDMETYRVEKKAAQAIKLPDQDTKILPSPVDDGGKGFPKNTDKLSNILKSFNEQFGRLFKDSDRVFKRIREDIAPRVAADEAYQNAKKHTPGAAKLEHDKALQSVMLTLLKDDTEVYKHFMQNEAFKQFVTDLVYQLTEAA